MIYKLSAADDAYIIDENYSIWPMMLYLNDTKAELNKISLYPTTYPR